MVSQAQAASVGQLDYFVVYSASSGRSASVVVMVLRVLKVSM